MPKSSNQKRRILYLAQLLLQQTDESHYLSRAQLAQLLAQQGLDYSDLIGVVAGGDRYVREMMLYQLDLRRERTEAAE